MSPLDRSLDLLGTSTVSDALDWAGAGGQLHGVRPLRPGLRIVGRAFTVRYQSCDVVPKSVGDFIDDVPAGRVIVIENGGRTDATVWGDLMTSAARMRGIEGTVIDGVNRDSDRAVELGYPIYSRGAYMRTGKDRVQIAGVEEPVTLCGQLAHPGDLVFGDSDGVVVVPAEREDAVIQRAWAIHDAEQEIRDMIAAGMTLRDARAKVGYHRLQTSDTKLSRSPESIHG